MGADYPYHRPYALIDAIETRANTKEAIAMIKDGVPIADAVSACFNVSPKRWFYWVKQAEEDIDKGYKNTELIDLVLALTAADVKVHRKFSKRAQDIALDEEEPSIEMLKFLLERRYGYKKKSAQEVEVSTPEDFSFNINITESKSEDGD